MARSSAVAIENNFSKGLVTEATGMNFPENSCIETWDCVFDTFGRVTRRSGFDFEFGYEEEVVDKTASAINVYLWKNVTGDGLTSFVVVQIGTILYFYDVASTESLSAGLSASTVDLDDFKATGATNISQYDCQFTDGLSKLYVAHPFCDNFYVEYDSSGGTFTGTEYTLKIRDVEGVEDSYGIDERKTETLAAMSDSHEYNLRNQGWITSHLTTWDTNLTTMPSNCDVWWTFKNSSDAFDTTTVANDGRGNSPAPKGHYILDYYNQDRDAAAGTSGVVDTTSGTARSSTVAFFAGRIFYAGVNAAGYTSKVLFTQIIERDSQLGLCYQSADPTSEDVFDLLPSDGGVISIPEAGTIYKLFAMGPTLLVFAYRGVWAITGSTGLGFTATDYTVSRISSVRAVSGTSFVDANGVPVWWNTDGIFTVTGDNGQPQVTSLTFDTIQRFYDAIPNTAKVAAKGVFNPLEQTIQWLFHTDLQGTVEEQSTFNAVLNFNVQTKAFYPWTISHDDGTDLPDIHGLVVVDATGGTVVQEDVVDGSAVLVVDSLGEQVVSYSLSQTVTQPVTKYLTSHHDGADTVFTWSEADDTNYEDWATHGGGAGSGEDYISYFITGYKVHGDAQRKFQANYVNFYNEGEGSFYVQGIWDYSFTANNGRRTTSQLLTFQDTNQLISFNDPDSVVLTRRRKIRGHGKSLQYYVRSETGEPFNLIGWSTWETGNTTV